MTRRVSLLVACVLLCWTTTNALAQPSRVTLNLEGAAVWLSRNDVRIPPGRPRD